MTVVPTWSTPVGFGQQVNGRPGQQVNGEGVVHGAEGAELVGVSEAARRLGVDKSLVSRQVRAWGLIGADKRFDFAAYESLRRNAQSPTQGGRRRPVAADAAPVGAAHRPALELALELGARAPAPPGASTAPGAPPAPPALVTEATQQKSLQNEILRLELEERRGRLVARSEVDEALETVARTLRDKLLSIGPRVAAELGGADAMAVKGMVDKAVRQALDELDGELVRALAGDAAIDDEAA